jgi:hypothetical protein
METPDRRSASEYLKNLSGGFLAPAFIFPPTCPPFPGPPTNMSTISSFILMLISTQSHSNTMSAAAPGAVVTVQCDYRTVSHSIGIVGVIYKVSKFGGARIATIAGILLSGSK